MEIKYSVYGYSFYFVILEWNRPRDVRLTNHTTALYSAQRCHSAPCKETTACF